MLRNAGYFGIFETCPGRSSWTMGILWFPSLSSDFGSFVRGLWQLYSVWSSEHPCSSSAVCQDSFHHLKTTAETPWKVLQPPLGPGQKVSECLQHAGTPIYGREGVDGASASHERSKQTTTRVRSSILISF